MNTQWRKILENLRQELNPGTFKVWVAPLQPALAGDELTLTAPNDFVARWVQDRLLSEIETAARAVLGDSVRVQVVAQSQAPVPPQGATLSSCADAALLSGESAARPAPRPLRQPAKAPLMDTTCAVPSFSEAPSTSFRDGAGSRPARRQSGPEQAGLPLLPGGAATVAPRWRYAFSDFVVGPCNDLAYAAARNMTRDSGAVDTLFLSSGPGLGKTHLTQAVGRALCEASHRSNPRIEYLSAESFASGFVHAMKGGVLDRFKARFQEVDVLLLEDVHFLQNKVKMQDEVLSTIKTLQERGGRVVLTSSFAPRELSNVDSSLVSRFCSGFLAGMEKPDYATRRHILEEKAKAQETMLSGEVSELMAERLTGDVRQIESCLHNLLLRAKLLGCQVSVDMALEVIAQYAQEDPFFDYEGIIRKVCEGFGLKPDQLHSRSRKSDLVVARNTVFYLARKHTELSLVDIGERFNRRHSTVLKGIAAVEREIKRESPLGRQIANTVNLITRNSRRSA